MEKVSVGEHIREIVPRGGRYGLVAKVVGTNCRGGRSGRVSGLILAVSERKGRHLVPVTVKFGS